MNEATPTFACRGGEYYRSGEQIDPLTELVEMQGEIERLETQLERGKAHAQERVGLQFENAKLRQKVAAWKSFAAHQLGEEFCQLEGPQ